MSHTLAALLHVDGHERQHVPDQKFASTFAKVQAHQSANFDIQTHTDDVQCEVCSMHYTMVLLLDIH